MPNCVSSTSEHSHNRIAAFRLSVPPEVAWPAIQKAITEIPRTEIVEATANYIHAKSSSRIFHFVDDLELLLHPADNSVSVRSAAAIGFSDLGVNRRRVQNLRTSLEESNIIKKEQILSDSEAKR